MINSSLCNTDLKIVVDPGNPVPSNKIRLTETFVLFCLLVCNSAIMEIFLKLRTIYSKIPQICRNFSDMNLGSKKVLELFPGLNCKHVSITVVGYFRLVFSWIMDFHGHQWFFLGWGSLFNLLLLFECLTCYTLIFIFSICCSFFFLLNLKLLMTRIYSSFTSSTYFWKMHWTDFCKGNKLVVKVKT